MIEYGSFFYFLYPAVTVLILAALTVGLRKCGAGVRKWACFGVAMLNLLQHLLKTFLYPHLWNTGFSYLNTAYNVCALLIIAMPFVQLCKKQGIRDFVFVTGLFAGLGTMFFPIWFIGEPAYGWELYRFYICHGLLFLSGALPFALGQQRVCWRSGLKFGAYFLLMLVLVLLNNILCIYMGLTPGASPEKLHEVLYSQNPLWLMGPRGGFEWVAQLLDPITPDFLLSEGRYVPVLWYGYPLWILSTLGTTAVFVLLDRKNFTADMQKLKQKRRVTRH